jgi:hypothetical protein
MQSVRKESFRRIFDTTVKSLGNDDLSVEVFLSDNGMPLILYVDYCFSERRINQAFWEIPNEIGPGVSRLIKEDLSELSHMEVKAGFVKKAQEAIKQRERSKALLDAMIENARMLAQVDMLSLDQLEEMDITDPLAWRQMDLTIWPELADGCFAYTKEIKTQLKVQGIIPACRLDIYAPSPGQICRWRRDKIIECELEHKNHYLSAYLSDDVHEFKLRITVSSKDQNIKTIHSKCIRAPFHGICNIPFEGSSELMGVSVMAADFKQRVVEAVGGSQGCVHLTDLVLGLVRYYQDVTE